MCLLHEIRNVCSQSTVHLFYFLKISLERKAILRIELLPKFKKEYESPKWLCNLEKYQTVASDESSSWEIPPSEVSYHPDQICSLAVAPY